MGRSGRFDFWGMLLHTHAITPPQAMPSLWFQMTKLSLPGWLVLTTIAAVGIGGALYVGNLPSSSVVVSQPTAVTVPGPAKPYRPW